MKRPVRLAILETDETLDRARAKYGGYGDIFRFLLRAGAQTLDGCDFDNDLVVTTYQVVHDLEAYPRLEDVDAILVSGSRYDSFADSPWTVKLVKYISRVLDQDRIRVIGVCFGHQIVARALGASVRRNDGHWEVGVYEIKLSETGRRLFGQDILSLHQLHQDIVHACPEGVHQLGSTPICAVQGMYVPHRLLTLQGHPEFDEEVSKEVLEARFMMGLFDETASNANHKRIALRHDGVVVARAFVQFLLAD